MTVIFITAYTLHFFNRRVSYFIYLFTDIKITFNQTCFHSFICRRTNERCFRVDRTSTRQPFDRQKILWQRNESLKIIEISQISSPIWAQDKLFHLIQSNETHTRGLVLIRGSLGLFLPNEPLYTPSNEQDSECAFHVCLWLSSHQTIFLNYISIR